MQKESGFLYKVKKFLGCFSYDAIVGEWYSTARAHIKLGHVKTISKDKIEESLEKMKDVRVWLDGLPGMLIICTPQGMLNWVGYLDNALAIVFFKELNLTNVLAKETFFDEKDPVAALKIVLSKIDYMPKEE
jgi:hypothetical protein